MPSKHALASKRRATKVDKAIGFKIRQCRVKIKLTQSALGKSLGISFQQVQKYEQGQNRVPTTRLNLIAELLNVSVAHFYNERATDKVLTAFNNLDSLTTRAIKAYSKIASKELRHQIVSLVEQIAENQD